VFGSVYESKRCTWIRLYCPIIGNHAFFRDLHGNVTFFDVPGRIASINNRNDVTGSFSDGTGVHGFVRSARCLPFTDKRTHAEASDNKDRPRKDRDDEPGDHDPFR